jgi:hypothetical protein
LIKFLKLSLNNICILFKRQIDILSFIIFIEYSINIKLCLLFFRDCLLDKKKICKLHNKELAP